jgi:capsular polysaccharide biosynthesis protein
MTQDAERTGREQDTQSARTAQTTPPDDFDVDLGTYFRAVARLWWLVVGLAVVGAVAGLLVASLTTRTYSATSAVYLGQQTDANGTAINGLTSNARIPQQILQGRDVLDEAAWRALNPSLPAAQYSPAAVDRTVGRFARQIGHGLVVNTPTTKTTGSTLPTNYVTITVTNNSGKKAAVAANALAQVLVDRLGAYPAAKIDLLKQQIKDNGTLLAAAQARLTAAGGNLQVAQAASTEMQALQTSLQAERLALLVAQNVEAPQIFSAAVSPGSLNAVSRRLSVAGGFVAGAVIGLVIVAFATRRRSPAQPPAAPAT